MRGSPWARRGDGPRFGDTTLGRRDLLRAGAGGVAGGAGVATVGDPTAAQSYGGWLSGVSNYDGTVDYTGREEATVSVGAGEDGLLFDPSAVLVDPGTTVVWEWTGAGGAHGVAHEPDVDGEPIFESEVVGDADHTFSHEFQDRATFRYYCPSHRGAEMKGIVAVGSTEDALAQPDGGDGDGDDGGGSLTTVDLVVAGTAVALGVVLVLMAASAASSPGPGPDRDRPE